MFHECHYHFSMVEELFQPQTPNVMLSLLLLLLLRTHVENQLLTDKHSGEKWTPCVRKQAFFLCAYSLIPTTSAFCFFFLFFSSHNEKASTGKRKIMKLFCMLYSYIQRTPCLENYSRTWMHNKLFYINSFSLINFEKFFLSQIIDLNFI